MNRQVVNRHWPTLLGAAFLMATSAIGPGFLTQTAVFTTELGASFAFVILLSVLIDAIAQLTIWRVIAAARQPAQQIANRLQPGLGNTIAILIFLGGLAFSIGNIAGAGLGLNALLGIDNVFGAVISTTIAIALFVFHEAKKAVDVFVNLLGILMIGLTLYVTWKSRPPLADAAVRAIIPEKFSFMALLTIVGGTVGGYITFAGAHRLLDAGVVGKQHLPSVTRSALSAVGIAAMMRILLFLAALGVVSQGYFLDPENPPASVFHWAVGEAGFRLFGLVMWSAAITSVIGSAYTSVSFIRTLHPRINQLQQSIVIGFIFIACVFYLIIGRPVKTLIVVGALNGLILPLSLGVMLIAAYRPGVVADYKQPRWLTVSAIIVVVIMAWMGLRTLYQQFVTSP